MGKTIRRSFLGTWMVEKYRIGTVYLFTDKQGLFTSVYVDDIKNGWKEARIMAHMWKQLD